MSGFTQKEIDAELARRKSGDTWEEAPSTVPCMHCGHPVSAGDAGGFPLCDACDGD
jgi:hypothetical protein